jgi:hypothetical protein
MSAHKAVRNRKSPTPPWIGKERRGTMMPSRLTDTPIGIVTHSHHQP